MTNSKSTSSSWKVWMIASIVSDGLPGRGCLEWRKLSASCAWSCATVTLKSYRAGSLPPIIWSVWQVGGQIVLWVLPFFSVDNFMEALSKIHVLMAIGAFIAVLVVLILNQIGSSLISSIQNGNG